jgi:hypothetical protein
MNKNKQVVAKRLMFGVGDSCDVGDDDLDETESYEYHGDHGACDISEANAVIDDSTDPENSDSSGSPESPGYVLQACDKQVLVEPSSPKLMMSASCNDSVERGTSFAAEAEADARVETSCILQDDDCGAEAGAELLHAEVRQQSRGHVDEHTAKGGAEVTSARACDSTSARLVGDGVCSSAVSDAGTQAKAASCKQPGPAKRASPHTPKSGVRSSSNKPITATPSPNTKTIRSSAAITPPPSASSRQVNANRPTTPTPHRRAPFNKNSVTPQGESSSGVRLNKAPPMECQASSHHDNHHHHHHAQMPASSASCDSSSPVAPTAHSSRASLQHVRLSPSLAHSGAREQDLAKRGSTRDVACVDDLVSPNADRKLQQQAMRRHEITMTAGTIISNRSSAGAGACVADHQHHDASPQTRAQNAKPFARVAPGPGLNNKIDLMSSIRLARKGTGLQGKKATSPRQNPASLSVSLSVYTF